MTALQRKPMLLMNHKCTIRIIVQAKILALFCITKHVGVVFGTIYFLIFHGNTLKMSCVTEPAVKSIAQD